ncbi:ABC-three component system protein [Pseudoalteromonas ulvae]|uniref:ABC-three component systems C-terminal domain-containing protein n=1 Tax=Pseudoalteromonas ulvae TaxID=107327 RepID=A0A244CUP1_PSEDV|nr:ABC-three component system protein [Pseudoalteromonas ulvae]OUL59294.1 hypothetical protein B1199_03220 [Pseudoalteromonas ulvae]
MIESNKVDQSDINADKVIGRDDKSVTNNTYIQNAPIIFKADANLQKLIDAHEKEIEQDPSYKEFTERLHQFLYKKVDGELRDLEQKLDDGGREHLIMTAMDAKEKITKKITKSSNYKSAQDIYTYLLSNIRVAFQHEIYGRVKSGSFHTFEIDDLVVEKIIDPYLHNIEGCSLNIDKEDIYGLLYILTGNCYIQWD